MTTNMITQIDFIPKYQKVTVTYCTMNIVY